MNFKIFIFIFCLSFLKSGAQAYTIAVVYDEHSQSQATELVRTLNATEPFDALVKENRVTFTLVPAKAKGLNCENGKAVKVIERVASCDLDYAWAVTKEKNPDRVFVISDAVNGGTAIGSYVVVGIADKKKNKSAQSIAGLAAHELLHSWGFGDEYKLDTTEAKIYCDHYRHAHYPNLVALPDHSPYPSDSAAKSMHHAQIPWFGQIKASTRITSGSNLGTPSETSPSNVPSPLVGLFPAGTCELDRSPFPLWKPTLETTVMENGRLQIPPAYFRAIYEAVGTPLPPAIPNKSLPPTSQMGRQ